MQQSQETKIWLKITIIVDIIIIIIVIIIIIIFVRVSYVVLRSKVNALIPWTESCRFVLYFVPFSFT